MRLALGTRIVLLVILSPMVISAVLGAWFLFDGAQRAQTQVQQRGEILIRQLAVAAQGPVQLRDNRVLRDMLAAAMLDPAVQGVSVETPQGEKLLRSRKPELNMPPPLHWLHDLQLSVHRHPSFRAPIIPAAPALGVPSGIDMGHQPLGWVHLEMNPHPLLLQQWGHAARVAGVFFIFLTLTLALGLWARSTVTRPLEQLTGVVRRLGQGDLRTRVQLLAGGEVGALARAINRTAISMERSQKDLSLRIDQATRELRQTLESVEIQNAELDIARKRALVGSRVKSEFLANMSHEIRTPINGILGFADLLSHSRLDEEQQDYVVTIKDSCSNLLSLVNDILDFTKMEAGKLVIDNVAFDLRDCVEEVLSLMAPAAYGKSLELIHLIYSDVPLKLYGDPIRIRQVLTNLVHNSIKFTPQGRIVVRVMLEEQLEHQVQLRVTVTDTGIGLSEAERKNLFKAFGQADTSITRRFGGAGLGLIICQKLVQQMGGEIGLESQPEQGSTFWFTLRCTPQRNSSGRALAAGKGNPLAGRKVLLFDQHVLSRLATRHILESWDMAVVEVEKQENFVARLTGSETWDMALFGLSRAELNGRQFHAAISGLPPINIPLVVLASTVDRNELRNLYQQGARVCLPRAARRQTLYREMWRLLTPPSSMVPAARPAAPEPLRRPQPRPQLQFSSITALVADDNEINRKLVSTILNRHGIQVDEAGDGRKALEKAAAMDYTIIFMDIQMPVMSGETAAASIRERQSGAGGAISRIVALTANALPGERERLLSGSMDECLIKPVTQEQLLAQVRIVAPHPDKPGEQLVQAGSGQDQPDPLPGQTLTEELRGMLLKELPAHKRTLQNAYRRGDLAELKEQVHRLHGAASVCQVPELHAACQALEKDLAENSRVNIPGGFQRMVRDINALLSEA